MRQSPRRSAVSAQMVDVRARGTLARCRHGQTFGRIPERQTWAWHCKSTGGMTSNGLPKSSIRLLAVSLLLLGYVLASCNAPPGETLRPASTPPAGSTDPLPSWNEGEAKRALVEFVERTTTQGRSDFVPPAERIAVFDNDGTLWSEQPMYFQLAFALDRI